MFDTKKIYYLSGPMTGYPNYNYEKFQEVSEFLRASGIKLYSPHENPWPEGHENMKPEDLWAAMMKLCQEQMDKCDNIILIRGWAKSKGARIELNHMLDKGADVFFFNDYRIIDMNRDAS